MMAESISMLSFLVLVLDVAAKEVILIPSGQVIFGAGDRADFVCFSMIIDDNIVSIQWLVNGTRIEEMINVGANISFDDEVGQLSLTNLPVEYNTTTIQCVATFRSGTTSSSSAATPLIQGLLPAIDSLTFTLQHYITISLTWTAPFSLDIPNVDPDITYCVDVVDSSSISTLQSQCGFVNTGFNYSLCNEEATSGDYTFAITPVNVVGNGTSATVHYFQALTAPRVNEQQLMPLSSMNGVYTYQITLSSLVCESELTFEDVDTGEETRLGDSDLIISNNTIMFTTAQLNTNRLYSVSVSVSNPSGSALSNITINTHNVLDTTIISTFNMGRTEFAIQTEYSAISSASGVLYSFMLMERNRIDFSKSTYLPPLNMSESLDYRLLLHLSPGTYSVFAYDIENDGRLLNGVKYPASRSQLFIGGNLSTNTSFHSECNVDAISGCIFVFCNFSSSKFAGFQMIVQNANIDEVHKLLVNTTTDQLTPATVQVPDNGRYHITILYIDRHTGILGSTPYHYTLEFSDEIITNLIMSTFSSATFGDNISLWIGVGVGSSALLLILAVAVMLMASVLRCYKSSKQRQVSADRHTVSPPSVPVYEEIDDSPGAFKYTQCPIYGLSPDDVLMSEEV